MGQNNLESLATSIYQYSAEAMLYYASRASARYAQQVDDATGASSAQAAAYDRQREKETQGSFFFPKV